MDRSLTFKPHLTKTAAKINTRNNILHKIAGSSWGANARVLKTTAMALTYSVAEYCCPVWINSNHTHLIDTRLNSAMRIITGTIRSTPIQWLPVLSNITPPHLRRRAALVREWKKCTSNVHLPIHDDCENFLNRLKSRKPPWVLGQQLLNSNFRVEDCWRDEWSQNNPDLHHLITDPVLCPPGFNLPRKTWTTLNRFRTNHGRTRFWTHKWGLTDSPNCDCGHSEHTPFHIATECPLTKAQFSLNRLHEADLDAIEWIAELNLVV